MTTMQHRAGAFAAVVLLTVFGCGRQGSGGDTPGLLADVTVRDIGGVSGVPLREWRLAPVPSFRVGGGQDGPAHRFVEITAATMRADGSVVVADARTGVVRLYDPEGHPLGQLGAPGEGPGEFAAPSSVVVVPGDSIVVWDRQAWRISVFGPDARFVRTERYDPTAPGVYPVDTMWPESVRLGGDRASVVLLAAKSLSKGGSVPLMDSVGLAVHRRGSANVELIAMLPDEEEVEVMAPWGAATLAPPLAASPEVALDESADRVCVGHGARAELLCLDRSGERIGLTWDAPARPVRSEDAAVAHWREDIVSDYSAKIPRTPVEEMISQVALPEEHPAFSEVVFDSFGDLWIRMGPSLERDGEDEYLVLGDELRSAGRFNLPTMRLVEVGPGHVLGVRRDTLGLEEVVAFRLDR